MPTPSSKTDDFADLDTRTDIPDDVKASIRKLKARAAVATAGNVTKPGGGVFKLKAGVHVQALKDWTPPIDPSTGRPFPNAKAPDETFVAGDGKLIESDRDLVADHGANKFEKVAHKEPATADSPATTPGGIRVNRTPGDPTDFNLKHNPAKTDAGQVSTGMPGGSPEQIKKAEEAVKSGEKPSPVNTTVPPLSTIRPTVAEIDAMSLRDLKEFAADKEIDLGGAVKKEDIAAKIKAAL